MNKADEARQLCRAAVRQLIQSNDWRLLSEELFAQAVLAGVPPGPATEPEPLRKWSINTYCRQALYPACCGRQGEQKRQRGFEELATYLYRLACRSWPQVAEDATQEALIRVYTKLEHCRVPGAFLAFAIQQLRDAARKYTKTKSREDSLDALLERDLYGDIAADAGMGTVETERVEDAVLYRDLRRQVAGRIKEIHQQNPRAGRQLEAARLRYIEELGNEEIAAVLGTTPENVSVLIYRGLEKLRKDRQLRELANEIWQRAEYG